MLTNKFDYATLTRKHINNKRFYTLDGREDIWPMPSVTTILDSTTSKEKKDKLEEWRKRKGKIRADQITYEAASRGTRMHKYLELYVENGNIPTPSKNPYAIHSSKMAIQIINEGLVNVNEYWGIEVPLCVPNIYAGTTDCVGIHEGSPSIIDFKQTNKPKKREWINDYMNQLVAYGEAHNELYGTNIKKGVIMMCSKEFEYQEFILEGDEWDYFMNKWWERVEAYYKQNGFDE